MAACAASHRADAVGVNVESVCIGSEKAHGCFDVLNRRRKLMARREPITDGSRNVSPLRQLDRHRQVTLPCASAESSAVDEHDSGPLLRMRLEDERHPSQHAGRRSSIPDPARERLSPASGEELGRKRTTRSIKTGRTTGMTW